MALERSLPPYADLVISRSRQLDWHLKAIWLHDRFLDRSPEGSFAGAPYLANRIGLSTETVERGRRELIALELHGVVRRPGGRRGDGWYSVLPSECVPQVSGGRRMPTENELDECRDRLDQHVFFLRRTPRGDGVNSAATNSDSVAAHVTPQTPPKTARIVGVPPEARSAGGGGKGGEGSRSSVSGSELSRSTELLRNQTASHEAGTTSQRRARGGAPLPIDVAGAALLDRFSSPPPKGVS